MEAKDTVMNDAQIIRASGKSRAIFPIQNIGELEKQLRTQAEISFKAGIDEGIRRAMQNNARLPLYNEHP